MYKQKKALQTKCFFKEQTLDLTYSLEHTFNAFELNGDVRPSLPQ